MSIKTRAVVGRELSAFVSLSSEQRVRGRKAPSGPGAACGPGTASGRSGSVERRLHGGCQQSSQLSDVVKRVDVEDGVLDGGLPFGGDSSVRQLGVLVANLRVRKVPVAGAARVCDLGGVSAPVVECHAHSSCELLVDREVI